MLSPPFFCCRRRAIAVDDGHIEKAALVEPQHYDRENDIETATGLPPPKGAINPGVVDLGAPLGVLCNRQLLPLTSQVQQFQDVVEQGMQGQLRCGAAASNGQVRQDKLSELLQVQFGRNAPGLHAFGHLDPQRNGSLYRNQAIVPEFHIFKTLPMDPTRLETRNQ